MFATLQLLTGILAWLWSHLLAAKTIDETPIYWSDQVYMIEAIYLFLNNFQEKSSSLFFHFILWNLIEDIGFVKPERKKEKSNRNTFCVVVQVQNVWYFGRGLDTETKYITSIKSKICIYWISFCLQLIRWKSYNSNHSNQNQIYITLFFFFIDVALIWCIISILLK